MHRIWPAMAFKHGYTTAEEYKKDALQKFSLLENGILEKPSTRLLLINVSGDQLQEVPKSVNIY